MVDHRGQEFSGQGRGCFVALRFGKVALQDRIGGALPEVGLEDGSQRESTSRSSPALTISLRPHRR